MKWILFWLSLPAVLLGLLWFKNSYSYPQHSQRWRAIKSIADAMLIVLAAARLPMLLVAWTVLWLTKPIKNSGLRVTVSVIAGLLFGIASQIAMEFVVLFSVFSVDLITGNNGFWNNLKIARAQEHKPVLAAAA